MFGGHRTGTSALGRWDLGSTAESSAEQWLAMVSSSTRAQPPTASRKRAAECFPSGKRGGTKQLGIQGSLSSHWLNLIQIHLLNTLRSGLGKRCEDLGKKKEFFLVGGVANAGGGSGFFSPKDSPNFSNGRKTENSGNYWAKTKHSWETFSSS